MPRARNILIVDDDLEFRAALREVLQQEGCTVFEAGDGKAALAVLRTVLPDLIFLDLMMPVMNGWDFHAHLQSEPTLSAIPVACLSGVDRMAPRGSLHVLHKPVNLPTLLGLLQVLEQPNRPSIVPHL
jgi:CheY-like chemotaxis protein